MAVEEQTSGSFFVRFAGGVNWNRVGQRLTITNRVVSKLAFKTKREGSLTATITFTIRRVSNDSIITSKVYGNAGSVPTSAGFIEVTFDTPVFINEEVRILMEWSGALGDVNNYLEFWATTPSAKPSENVTRYYLSYENTLIYDATYRYTYTDAVAPTVTTQAVSSIGETTATGNGNITDLGSVNPTAHGMVYSSIESAPTLSDSVTDEGAASSTGAFTSDLTGLVPGLLYYVRSYATNAAGTAYGSVVTFLTVGRTIGAGWLWQDDTRIHFGAESGAEVAQEVTLSESASRPAGTLWSEGTKLNIIDEDGDERSDEGTATGDTGPEGTTFIEGNNLHYLDAAAGAERTL